MENTSYEWTLEYFPKYYSDHDGLGLTLWESDDTAEKSHCRKAVCMQRSRKVQHKPNIRSFILPLRMVPLGIKCLALYFLLTFTFWL